MATEAGERRPGDPRLLYLLKLAHLRLGGLIAPALAPSGIDPRELAVLTSLAGAEWLSQQQLARALGIDRTTMVGLVDALEGKGLVDRRPHPDDRRKNVVELTPAGRETLGSATEAVDEAEDRFLAPVPERDARRLRETLRALVQEAAEP